MTSNQNNPTWTYCPLQVNSVSINDDGTKCVFGTSFERGTGYFGTYIMDNDGNQILKKETSSTETTQGVFWVDISGDGLYCATGGEFSQSQGFLQAYLTETGGELLNITTDSRINQVSLSKDGQYLAACFGSTLNVYHYNSTSIKYELIATESLSPYNINSCVISRDGSTVIASGIEYSDDSDKDEASTSDTTTGKVFSFSISANQVTTLGSCALTTGSMRVAVTDNGLFWVASLHDGGCLLIDQDDPSSVVWYYKPNILNLSLAYAVDITLTESNNLLVACGANLDNSPDGGLLYLVETVGFLIPKCPEQQLLPLLKWSKTITYGVNPGVSMDLNATYVTATDGKPDGQTVKESAGSFYLFSGATGDLVWKYDTTMMNWPMKLARDGKSVFAGSDDGNVYYWDLGSS